MFQPVVTLQPTPHLVLRTDSDSRRLPLAGSNCWTIGRSEDNNFVLPDRWISRNHAMLQCMETGEFYLIDLGSRNGSFVNGRRVSIPVTLHNGDRLTFGQTELDFYCPTLNPPADSAASDSKEFGQISFDVDDSEITFFSEFDHRHFSTYLEDRTKNLSYSIV